VSGDRLSVEPSLFSERTTIRWQMTNPGQVVLRVLDNTGRVVRTFGDSRLEPGSYSVVWNGKDAAGRRLGRGAYFCELRTASRRLVARTVLIE
jgi:flagellar hook assembly protein FlgD